MESIIVHMSGAIYSTNDVIIFKVLKVIGEQYYMEVLLLYEEVMEDTFIFRWDQIPEAVLQIYNFITSKSGIINKTLFGPHLFKNDEKIYCIRKINKNIIGQTLTIDLNPSKSYYTEMFSTIARHICMCMK